MLGAIDNLLLKLRFREKGVLLVSIPLLFEIVFVTFLSISYAEAQNEARIAEHGRRVLTITDAITTAIFAVGASFFVSSTLDPGVMKARFDTFESTLEGLISTLVAESKPYKDEAKFVEGLVESTRELQEHANRMRAILEDPLQMVSQSAFRASRKKANHSLHNLADAIDKLNMYEHTTAGSRLAQARGSRQRLHFVLYAGVIFNILLSIWLAVVFGRQVTQRLAVVGRNAIRMSRQETLQESVAGTDELADLDRLLHNLSGLLTETMRRERAMIDNTADVICAISSDLQVLRTNAAMQAQWGWTQEAVEQASLVELVLADQRDLFKNQMAVCRQSPGGTTFECSVMRSDGGLIESRWSVLWSEFDQSYFAIVRDVGEEKETDRLRKQFFSMITHDLRSPLANVKGFLQMMENGSYGQLNEKGQAKIARIEQSLGYMIRLTEDLLEIGRLQSGKVSLALESIDAELLIDECCAILDSLPESKTIKLKTNIEPGCFVLGDVLRVKQVLVNLMTNAIKFSPSGSQIELHCLKQDDMVKFVVKDSGPGLTPDECRKIFEPYVQAASGQERKGFGLGLAIARAVVDGHGGKIGVTSDPGQGASFYFELPLARAVAEE